MNSDRNRSTADYMDLPYTLVIRRDDEGDFVARIDELPGCSAHGKTVDEAAKNVREAQQLWIEDAIEAGHAVPEPEPQEPLPSGKWVQRVPRSLHKRLTQIAKRENVSLNQLVTSMLSEAITAKSWTDAIWARSAGHCQYLGISDPSDTWDPDSAFNSGSWQTIQSNVSSGLLQSLSHVWKLGPSYQELSFPLRDAYKKEITEYEIAGR